ncbi:MAG: hypothetical protein M1831_006287 [Alyxoria varia]|nr:MAG: hypothetical protein M1831_006287 [Alyxoria varia]
MVACFAAGTIASVGLGADVPKDAGKDHWIHNQIPFSAGSDESTATQNGMDSELLPLTFNPVALGSITPSGWLRNELELEADGLAGHERDFLDWVADSSWTGGSSEYSPLNEGFPYWYNGIVPLAYSLNDERLKSQISEATLSILSRQAEDGWIGPEETVTQRNFWARMPLLLDLTNLVDADPNTWSEPVLAAFKNFVPLMYSMLANNGTGYLHHDGDAMDEADTTWGRVRSQDMLISLMWMYEKHPQGQERMLLDSMRMFYSMSMNWDAWFNDAVYVKENLYNVPLEISASNYPYLHGVNVGQAWTFQYHGSASGNILADEREVGLNPYYGSELCTAVEVMYSLSYLYQAIGDPVYADIAEKTTFNAMPAMMTGDWWAHQYMAQPNQPYSINLTASPFYNSDTTSQTFGLQPNYPCCAVNYPQGLPKFLMATYITTNPPNVGVAHVLLSPASIITKLPGTQTDVTIDCETSYPFDNTLNYRVHASTDFMFFVRVPDWAGSGSTISINDGEATELSPDSTGLHKLKLSGGPSRVNYNLVSSIRTEPRTNDTVAVFNGALMYALEMGSSNISRPPQGNWKTPPPSQALDFEIRNTTAWNYAIDTSTLTAHVDETKLASPGFAPGAPPNYITTRACRIDWPLFLDSVPDSPPTREKRKCVGSSETVRLVPYGSAKIRMGELPTIDLSGI